MSTYKIGQIIEFINDFEIEDNIKLIKDMETKEVGTRKVSVKKGDSAIITTQGYVHILDGKAEGMEHKLEDVEVQGYDHKSIAKMIFDRLENAFDLTEYLGDDYYMSSIEDEIEETLVDILC